MERPLAGHPYVKLENCFLLGRQSLLLSAGCLTPLSNSAILSFGTGLHPASRERHRS